MGSTACGMVVLIPDWRMGGIGSRAGGREGGREGGSPHTIVYFSCVIRHQVTCGCNNMYM